MREGYGVKARGGKAGIRMRRGGEGRRGGKGREISSSRSFLNVGAYDHLRLNHVVVQDYKRHIDKRSPVERSSVTDCHFTYITTPGYSSGSNSRRIYPPMSCAHNLPPLLYMYTRIRATYTVTWSAYASNLLLHPSSRACAVISEVAPK